MSQGCSHSLSPLLRPRTFLAAAPLDTPLERKMAQPHDDIRGGKTTRNVVFLCAVAGMRAYHDDHANGTVLEKRLYEWYAKRMRLQYIACEVLDHNTRIRNVPIGRRRHQI